MTAGAHIAIIDAIGAHGGMHYYTDNQATALVDAGHLVTVYSMPASTDVNSSYEKVQIFKRIYGKDSKVTRGLRFLRDIALALLSARRKGAKVVIYHLFKMDGFDRFVLAGARRFGLRTIAIVHDVERLDQSGDRGHLTSIAHNCDMMVVHNKFSEEALRRTLEGSTAKVRVIPSGNFIAQFPSPPSKADARGTLGLPENKTIILFFGNPRREKGLHILTEALIPHREASNLLILIAGKMKPAEEAEHRAFVEENGLSERVRFDIGHVSDAALPSYYRAADVVALPYLRIYESGVALMSMSLERSVIASDLPPLREVVGGDARGLLFTAGDAADLSGKIGELLRGQGGLEQLEKNAALYARKERDWKVTGKMLSQTVIDIL